MSAKRSLSLFTFVLALIALLLPSGAGSVGAVARIDAGHVGPLRIGVATKARVLAWAGVPSKVWTKMSDQAPVLATGTLWEYDCAGTSPVDGQACMSLYGMIKGRLKSFWTNDSRFRTPKGVTIGTPLKTVLKRYKTAKWLGWGYQCPGVILPTAAKSITFVAQIEKKGGSGPAQVYAFYLSATPESFGACGS